MGEKEDHKGVIAESADADIYEKYESAVELEIALRRAASINF